MERNGLTDDLKEFLRDEVEDFKGGLGRVFGGAQVDVQWDGTGAPRITGHLGEKRVLSWMALAAAGALGYLLAKR